jgi:hypothetical protein
MEILVMADGGDPGSLPDPSAIPSDVALRVMRPQGAEPCGVDAARDAGLMAAGHSTVLLLDAHCDLPGSDWVRFLVTWSVSHPRTIGCCVCVGLDDALPTPSTWQHRPRYHGARIDLVGHDGGTWRVFCDKWLDDPVLPKKIRMGVPQRIPSPLGGAYVMQRDWYVQGLGRPWYGMAGWGCSEVTLAMVGYFAAGGGVALLPLEIAHYFRGSAPYQTDLTVILFNQLRLLHILPMPPDLRGVLVAWLLDRNPVFRGVFHAAAMARLARTRSIWEPLAYAAASSPHTWANFVKHFHLQPMPLQETVPVR